MTRQTVTLYSEVQGRTEMKRLWLWCKSMLAAEHRLTVEARPEKRSDAQNRLMWSALGDCARQITWHGQKLDAEAWKDMATAALKRQRVVPGIDGGFVVLGTKTSQMTKAEMTELVDFIHAFGTQQGVQWSPASIAMNLNELEQA